MKHEHKKLRTTTNGPYQQYTMLNGLYRQCAKMNYINPLRATKNCPNEKRVVYHNEWPKRVNDMCIMMNNLH